MLKQLNLDKHIEVTKVVTFTFEGKIVEGNPNHSLAEILLEKGIYSFRKTLKERTHRAPYCMMGVCYDCLLNINGENLRACKTFPQEGMIVRRVDNPENFPQLSKTPHHL